VKWSHAWAGGLLVSAGFELAKKLLTLYLAAMPTYSMVYGAFATVPILLVWIYLAWLIVLVAAVLVASLPGLLQGELRVPAAHGWHFQLALELLRQFDQARTQGSAGLTLADLGHALRVDPAQLEPVLHGLTSLDWVAQLDELQPKQVPRYVLLANLDTTPLAPLAAMLLLSRTPETETYWQKGLLPLSSVRSLL
jgi:membrane protein